jgi:hypothetical protein
MDTKSNIDVTRCPPISKELLDYLKELYPDRLVSLQWSEREIFFKAGQRNVVDFLIDRYKEQNTNVLL